MQNFGLHLISRIDNGGSRMSFFTRKFYMPHINEFEFLNVFSSFVLSLMQTLVELSFTFVSCISTHPIYIRVHFPLNFV